MPISNLLGKRRRLNLFLYEKKTKLHFKNEFYCKFWLDLFEELKLFLKIILLKTHCCCTHFLLLVSLSNLETESDTTLR